MTGTTHAYPVSSRLIVSIIAVPLTGLFVFIGCIPLTFDEPDTVTTVAFALFGAIPVILIALGVGETLLFRITIDADKITRTGVFGKRTLRLVGIKEYEEKPNGIRLIPRDLNSKAIGIPHGLVDSERLMEAISAAVPRIAAVDTSDETAAPDTISQEKNETGVPLQRLRLITRIMNIGSVVAAAWYYFVPSLPSTAVTAASCVLLPPAGIALMLITGRTADINADPKSGRPVLLATLLALSFVMMLSFISFNILDFSGVWSVMAVVFVLTLAAMVYASGSIRTGRGQHRGVSLVLSIFIALQYSFGFTVVTNMVLDRSEPRRYTATVIKKFIGSGKSHSTNFVLGPWGPVTEEDTIIVPLALYKAKEPGDSVTILLKEGLYNIPTYVVAE